MALGKVIATISRLTFFWSTLYEDVMTWHSSESDHLSYFSEHVPLSSCQPFDSPLSATVLPEPRSVTSVPVRFLHCLVTSRFTYWFCRILLHSTAQILWGWHRLKKLVQETCTDARDQNHEVWLVGCVWKFLVYKKLARNRVGVLFGANFLRKNWVCVTLLESISITATLSPHQIVLLWISAQLLLKYTINWSISNSFSGSELLVNQVHWWSWSPLCPVYSERDYWTKEHIVVLYNIVDIFSEAASFES